MERIVYRKTLDAHKNGVQFTLQGFETADNISRRIEISLMASGDTIDIPLEQIKAMMYVTTPYATEPSINDCTIKDNKIIYDVLPIVEEGITEMQLKLIETSVEGAKSVLATPRFAVEVTKGNADDEDAMQTTSFTALEDAVAKATEVYASRLLRIELDSDCMFRAYYADGNVYETDILKELFLKGEALLSQSYARGGTGVRTGEDTDNSMYYSNVSKSASIQAEDSRAKSQEALDETRKHSLYTAFSVDFNTGEVKYISPSFKFNINEETGELNAEGEAFVPEETIDAIVREWLANETSKLDDMVKLETKAREIADKSLEERILNTLNNTISNMDYIVAYGEKNGWRYAKYKSGREEAWYRTSSFKVEPFTYQNFTFDVPNGIFSGAPTFIQPTFATGSSRHEMGLCEVAADVSDQTSSQISLRVYNAHSGSFEPRVCIYAMRW